MRATSVGSPTAVPFSSSVVASLARMAARTSRRWMGFSSVSSWQGMSSPSTKAVWGVILFWVRVPVLSEQITDTAPRVSTALSSFMMAFSLAIFWVPMAGRW